MPEKYTHYDHFLYVIDTEYEDFIVDLFSELPVTSTFLRPGGQLVVSAEVRRNGVGTQNKEPLTFLMVALAKNEIIKRKAIAVRGYPW